MRHCWILALTVGLLGGPRAGAETVYLHGGSVMKGKLLSKTASGIVLEVDNGRGGTARLTLPMTRIRRIGPDGETPEMMTEEGMRHLAAGDADKAEMLFNDALSARPAHAPARVGLALAKSSRGKLDAAIGELRRALLLTPADPLVWYHLGMLTAKQGRYDKALDQFRRAAAYPMSPALANKVRKQLDWLRQLTSKKPQVKSRAQLRTSRQNWDKNLGNNANAAGAGRVMKTMLKNLTRSIADFNGDIYVELKSHRSAEQSFADGGSQVRYQTSVRVAQVSFQVEMRSWEKLTNREKREIIGGWVRYLKDHYPYATSIAIAANGKSYLCEAIWRDYLQRVRFHWWRARDKKQRN